LIGSHADAGSIPAASTILLLKRSRAHTCALTTGGGVQCWGRNSDGQLGDGTTTDSSVPVAVNGFGSGIAAVAGGGNHTCALTTGGGVQCWGDNYSGQLGDGYSKVVTTPGVVVGFGAGVPALGLPALGLLAMALILAGASHRWSCLVRNGDA